MTDPILRSLVTTTRKVHAEGGLHYLRGNRLPYFSLTMASWVKHRGRWSEDCVGAAHEELVRLFPDLVPLAAMHLSDIDGVPMHAAENGWYWLAGASDVIRPAVKYHGGGDSEGPEYRRKSPEQCLEILAKHLRAPIGEARSIVASTEAAFLAVPQYARVWERQAAPAAKAHFTALVEAMRPRWAREARECIEALELRLYGDAWAPPEGSGMKIGPTGRVLFTGTPAAVEG